MKPIFATVALTMFSFSAHAAGSCTLTTGDGDIDPVVVQQIVSLSPQQMYATLQYGDFVASASLLEKGRIVLNIRGDLLQASNHLEFDSADGVKVVCTSK